MPRNIGSANAAVVVAALPVRGYFDQRPAR
jgi:hypothetical protein